MQKLSAGGMNVIKTHPSLPFDDSDKHAGPAPQSASGLMVMKTPADELHQ